MNNKNIDRGGMMWMMIQKKFWSWIIPVDKVSKKLLRKLLRLKKSKMVQVVAYSILYNINYYD